MPTTNKAPSPSLWKRIKRKLFGQRFFHQPVAHVGIMHTSDAFIDKFLTPYMTDESGNRIDAVGFRRACMDAMRKGYEVLPACENVDRKGYCKGHK